MQKTIKNFKNPINMSLGAIKLLYKDIFMLAHSSKNSGFGDGENVAVGVVHSVLHITRIQSP